MITRILFGRGASVLLHGRANELRLFMFMLNTFPWIVVFAIFLSQLCEKQFQPFVQRNRVCLVQIFHVTPRIPPLIVGVHPRICRSLRVVGVGGLPIYIHIFFIFEATVHLCLHPHANNRRTKRRHTRFLLTTTSGGENTWENKTKHFLLFMLSCKQKKMEFNVKRKCRNISQIFSCSRG